MRSKSLHDGQLITVNGRTVVSGYTWTVLTGGGYNAWGSWVEVIASAPFRIGELLFVVTTGSNSLHVLRIAIGASGAETSIVVDVPVISGQGKVAIPIDIPKGARVSCSIKNSGTLTLSCYVVPIAVSHNISQYKSFVQSVTKYAGDVLDPGGTVNAKGAWAEIVASCPFNIDRALICFYDSAISTARNWAIDIGVGAAGSERIIVPDLVLTAGAWTAPVPSDINTRLTIKRGERIAARIQSDNITVGSRELEIMFYGMGR